MFGAGCTVRAPFLLSRRLKVEREDTVQTGHIVYRTNRMRNEETQKKKKRTGRDGRGRLVTSHTEATAFTVLQNAHHWLVPSRCRVPVYPYFASSIELQIFLTVTFLLHGPPLHQQWLLIPL